MESAVSGAFLLLFGAFTHAAAAYSTGVEIPYTERTMAQQQLPAIHICLIHPAGYIHADALLDPAQYFYWQFRRLGLRVSLARNVLRHDAVNFIFGAHNGFDVRALQTHSCIIVNLEQIGQGGAALGSDYLRLLKSAVVVDYNPNNPPAYTNHPEDVPLVSFGHAGWMKPGPHDALPLEDRPLDLLFIGSVNQRRLSLLQQIEAAGRKVHLQACPVYGFARNSMVRQARGLLNLHFYDAARFEQVRAFMGLSLGTPVVSERLPNTSAGPVFDTCVTWFENEQLDTFFENEFASALYYDVSRQQLDVFGTVDPIGEYADLVGFANGVWQAHLRTLPARAGEDRLIGPRMPLPWVPEVARNVMVVGRGTTPMEPKKHPEAPDEGQTSSTPRHSTLSSSHSKSASGESGIRDMERPAPLFQFLPDAYNQVEQFIGVDQPDLAMKLILEQVNLHFCQPGIAEHALYYPDMDDCLNRLGKYLEEERTTRDKAFTGVSSHREGRKRSMLIASELYETGGHSRVLEDLANNLPSPIVVITDPWQSHETRGADKEQWLHARFADIEVKRLTGDDLWEKSRALADLCDHHQPESIWYLTHHQDPIGFVGSLPYATKCPARRLFVHHGDFNPALGCTLNGVHHIDVTETMKNRCCHHLHTPATWLPLYAPDQGIRPHVPGSVPLSVVMAGRSGKFTQEGSLALQDIVSAVLGEIPGSFHHIGNLPEKIIHRVRSRLQQEGISPDRWIYHGDVPSLWSALRTLNAHIYIDSAPISGGRAVIEAQGCGYPVLPFNDFRPGSVLSDTSSYASMDLAWKNIPELLARLPEAQRMLPALEASARRFYENQFSQRIFTNRLKEILH